MNERVNKRTRNINLKEAGKASKEKGKYGSMGGFQIGVLLDLVGGDRQDVNR